MHEFASGNAGEALRKLDEKGHVHSAANPDELKQKMIDDWSQIRDPGKPGETLLIAGTRSDVHALNQLARQTLIDAQVIDLKETIKTESGAEFGSGDRILFTRNSSKLDVKNGSLGSVIDVQNDDDKSVLKVKLDNNRVVEFDISTYKSIAYSYAITAHKSQGVTIDHALVMPSEFTTDREWSYVAASRARESTDLYISSDMQQSAHEMSQSRQKNTSTEYTQAPPPSSKQAEIEL